MKNEQHIKALNIRAGWITITDTPEIKTVNGDLHQFKKGDLLPSWLYASFPRGIREKFFKKNEKLLGDIYTEKGAGT